MTNDELNEKIRQACTHAAPDVLDAVLSDCNEQKGRVILMTTENKKKTWAVRMAGLAAGLCLILGGGLGVRNYQVNHTVDATVSLDVNPSVEIKINQKERILDVIPLNEDGRTIVGDMDFSGSSLDVAVNAIIVWTIMIRFGAWYCRNGWRTKSINCFRPIHSEGLY